jgi:hypothetical protein
MVHALSNSWIDDYSPGCWQNAPKATPKRRDIAALDNMILCAKLAYSRDQPDGGSGAQLETNQFAYWQQVAVEPTPDLVDASKFDQRDLCKNLDVAIRVFIHNANKQGRKPFQAVKACDNPSHLMCRHLVKK